MHNANPVKKHTILAQMHGSPAGILMKICYRRMQEWVSWVSLMVMLLVGKFGLQLLRKVPSKAHS